MENKLTHFNHSANCHEWPQFIQLRKKYGWAGEGRYWALNNRIAKSENCKLDLNNKTIFDATTAALELTPDEFNEFIEYLKSIHLVINYENEGMITTRIVQQGLVEMKDVFEFFRKKR